MPRQANSRTSATLRDNPTLKGVLPKVYAPSCRTPHV
jgi:hypothetical protein